MVGNDAQLVLVVDDEDDDFILTMRAFNEADLISPVQRCTNGQQALEYLLQRGEFAAPNVAQRPSIILLDLNLPGKDGLSVLNAIKTTPELQKIPVIVLTKSNDALDIENCYAAGANSYVQKTVDFDKFVKAIRRLSEFWLEVSVLPKVML